MRRTTPKMNFQDGAQEHSWFGQSTSLGFCMQFASLESNPIWPSWNPQMARLATSMSKMRDRFFGGLRPSRFSNTHRKKKDKVGSPHFVFNYI